MLMIRPVCEVLSSFVSLGLMFIFVLYETRGNDPLQAPLSISLDVCAARRTQHELLRRSVSITPKPQPVAIVIPYSIQQDFLAGELDDTAQSALAHLRELTPFSRVLGSYARDSTLVGPVSDTLQALSLDAGAQVSGEFGWEIWDFLWSRAGQQIGPAQLSSSSILVALVWRKHRGRAGAHPLLWPVHASVLLDASWGYRWPEV